MLSFQQDRDTWGACCARRSRGIGGEGCRWIGDEETLDERMYFGYNSRHTCLRRLRSTTPAAKKNLIERSPEWLNLSCVLAHAPTSLPPAARPLRPGKGRHGRAHKKKEFQKGRLLEEPETSDLGIDPR